MLLNIHERRVKEYLKIDKERDKKRSEARDILWVDVTPYRWGWTISVELKELYRATPSSIYMQEALNAVSYTYHTNDPNRVRGIRMGHTHVKKKYKSKRYRYGNRRRYFAWDAKDVITGIPTKAEKRSHIWGKTYHYYDKLIPINEKISNDIYKKLSHVAKTYFRKDRSFIDWERAKLRLRGEYVSPANEYLGEWLFNLNETHYRARADVKWITKEAIPNGEAQGDYEKLNVRWEAYMYRGYTGDNFHYNGSYGTWEKRFRNAIQRTRWRDTIRQYLKGDLDEDRMLWRSQSRHYKY